MYKTGDKVNRKKSPNLELRQLGNFGYGNHIPDVLFTL